MAKVWRTFKNGLRWCDALVKRDQDGNNLPHLQTWLKIVKM